MITKPGAKLLDFGLAKLRAAGAAPAVGGVSALPTAQGLTAQGAILGTLQYMAPEQLEGHEADARTDIFAFGLMLHEMVTGQKAFEGKSQASLIGAILKDTPKPVSALQPVAPPALDRLIATCLEKDPENRWQTARDVWRESRWIAEGGTRTGISAPVGAEPVALRHRLRLAWIATGAVVFVALAAVSIIHFRETPPTEQTLRFQISPPGASAAEMFTLSPDGRYLAFVANTGGPDEVWVRAMDTLEARALKGTDGATYPFWSPDAAYLGFFAQGKLKKIAIAGGPALTLCDATDGRGGTWNRDGAILFSASPTSPVLRVSAAGGVPVPVTTRVEGDSGAANRFPVFLPDGVHYLYTAGSLYLRSLDGAPPTRVLPDSTNALYVPVVAPGGSGYLVFRREDTLMAQAFDLKALRLRGESFPVAEQVPTGGGPGALGFGAFSASENGTLVYRTGGSISNRELVWVDRSGKRLRAATRPGAFGGLSISPDQRTAAVTITTGSQSDVWVQDLGRDVISRFTFRPGTSGWPVWSPDGKRLVYSVRAASTPSYDIYQKASAGNGQEELLLRAVVNGRPDDWSPDGKWLVFHQTGEKTALDLMLLPLEGDRKPIPYLQTPFNEANARFSPGPDSAPRWMAYESNESGQNQIYAQSIPASGAKYQISTSGGTQPTWRRDGKELFYLSTDRKMMAVPIKLGAIVEPGTPQELFAITGITGYGPSADGQRFLANLPAGGEGATAPPITVVLNWTAGLKK